MQVTAPTSNAPLAAWTELRRAGDIQFAPVREPPVEPPPEWLQALGRMLGRAFAWLSDVLSAILSPLAKLSGLSARTVETALIVIAGLVLAWFVWRQLAPRLRSRGPAASAAPEWTPSRETALALLEDADRLAAEGRYGEATQLLLQRSLGEIAASRPDLLTPSSTAREIGADPRLPQRAAGAFAVIAREVERSAFALARLAREDWQLARDAYAGFALTDGPRTG